MLLWKVRQKLKQWIAGYSERQYFTFCFPFLSLFQAKHTKTYDDIQFPRYCQLHHHTVDCQIAPADSNKVAMGTCSCLICSSVFSSSSGNNKTCRVSITYLSSHLLYLHILFLYFLRVSFFIIQASFAKVTCVIALKLLHSNDDEVT